MYATFNIARRWRIIPKLGHIIPNLGHRIPIFDHPLNNISEDPQASIILHANTKAKARNSKDSILLIGIDITYSAMSSFSIEHNTIFSSKL